MLVSQARIAANQANAARSSGPKTAEGKAISRRNSLKHGLTGEGTVLFEGDQAEVESRVDALTGDLKPQSSLGAIMIRKMATLSVRSERAAERENATIAQRVRLAVPFYDEERARLVDTYYNALPSDPRGALRNLRRMPEGVDRLLEAWEVLRRDLACDAQNCWGTKELARAANLIGVPHLDADSTRIGDLSNAIWGMFHRLTATERGDLDENGLRNWAKVTLLELIDGQIADLQEHRKTLDFDRIEQDRREAPLRATFDDSKEACMARRYEADADRGFYKALKEFRQVEAEASKPTEAAPALPIADQPEPKMGSFCGATPPRDREQALAFLDDLSAENPVVRGADGLPLSITRPVSPPV